MINNQLQKENMKEAYNSNADFKRYVDRYAHQYTSDDVYVALTHELVFQTYLYYLNRKDERNE